MRQYSTNSRPQIPDTENSSMKTTRILRDLTLNSFAIFAIGACVLAFDFARADSPVDIGSRRELFVDDYLIESMQGAELRLHSPSRREVVMTFDRPWEGNECGEFTCLRDNARCWSTWSAAFPVSPSSMSMLCFPRSARSWKESGGGSSMFLLLP